MLEVLDAKVRQMHDALGNLRNEDLSGLKVEAIDVPGVGFYQTLDFGQGQTPARLANTASLLVANIASLKDHLKVWCRKNGKEFTGDQLINSNHNVALVHDLWNIDKHAELDKSPRSGIRPKLQNLRQHLQLSTGTEANSSVVFQWDPRTGKMESMATGGGKAALIIDADVVDESGSEVGKLAAICEAAATEWENALKTAAVPVPVRT